MMNLGTRSKKSIKGVSQEMGQVIGLLRYRNKVDCTFIDGLRTAEQQNEKFRNGASKLDGYNKKSCHQSGNAVDFIPFPFNNNWKDPMFRVIWEELKTCAEMLGFVVGPHISWDGGHFEIRGYK